MDKNFWHERWRNGQIGFHSSQTHWALESYWPKLGLSVNQPVLVPLCGKSLDMRWLRQHGHTVEGVELDPTAVEAFFDEWRAEGGLANMPTTDLRCMSANGVRLCVMDFFQYKPARSFEAFYDRAALIALPEAMRPDYVGHLRSCLRRQAKGLLVTLEYDQSQKDGPPFAVLEDEVNGLNGFKARLLERRDVLADSPKFRERGVSSLHEAVYELTAV